MLSSATRSGLPPKLERAIAVGFRQGPRASALELSGRRLRHVLLAHLDAHPRAHLFVRDNQGRFEGYWGRSHPAVLTSSGVARRLGATHVLLLKDALLATERSPRNTALATAILAVEGDLRAAWNCSDQGARSHGLSGFGVTAALWKAVVAQADASFDECLDSYEEASRTDMAPIRRSALFGIALTASLIGRDRVADRAADRLLEEEPGANYDSFRHSRESFALRLGECQATRALERFFTRLGSDRASDLSLRPNPTEMA